MHPLLRAGLLLLVACLAMADAPAWDATPWLADLAQLRVAIDRDYPNREWVVEERQVSLDHWFGGAADAIRRSGSDAGARAALSRLVNQFGDGHLVLTWPASDVPPAGVQHNPASPSPPASAAAFCAALGYDARQVAAGTAAVLPGYHAIAVGGLIPAGMVKAGDAKIGVVRIGLFSPQGYPALCEGAVTRARVAVDKPCGDACSDRIMTDAYAFLTKALMTAVRRLRV